MEREYRRMAAEITRIANWYGVQDRYLSSLVAARDVKALREWACEMRDDMAWDAAIPGKMLELAEIIEGRKVQDISSSDEGRK